MRFARALVTPVVLVVLLGFLLWGAWWGYNNATAPAPVAPVTPCVTTSVGPKLASWRITVNVYNGGHTSGAAAAVAAQLKAKGFKIGKVGNTDERITATVIRGRAANDPSVMMVAGFFTKSTIEVNGNSDGTVDVYVGTQYGGFNTAAPNVVAVSSDVACLPVTQTPTPTPSLTTASASATPGA